MIKDFLGVCKDWGISSIIYGVGLASLILFGLSLIPSLSFIPKLFVYFVLTH